VVLCGGGFLGIWRNYVGIGVSFRHFFGVELAVAVSIDRGGEYGV
jgi:hypothetical protein